MTNILEYFNPKDQLNLQLISKLFYGKIIPEAMGTLRKLDMVKLRLSTMLKTDPGPEDQKFPFEMWHKMRPFTLTLLAKYYKQVEEEFKKFPMVDIRRAEYAYSEYFTGMRLKNSELGHGVVRIMNDGEIIEGTMKVSGDKSKFHGLVRRIGKCETNIELHKNGKMLAQFQFDRYFRLTSKQGDQKLFKSLTPNDFYLAVADQSIKQKPKVDSDKSEEGELFSISVDLSYEACRGFGYSQLGLRNIGNTCYMNSILQCLMATPPLTKFFRSGDFD